ncbi:glycosyltransferase family 2 protein [Roseiconus nitratireducens]|uniref:Glycosyltransferase family 2 protein n=1 Tax=Roseiconus nitratireducens TaxID=2605748 RepID=A0A5M6DFN9_9BACT|nr:glycosyltransferase family 2 protein [Roseiconus nitratireducens]
MRMLVVMINYRTAELTIDSLRSIADDPDRPGIRVVVVDNASGDDSADRIEQAIEREDWQSWCQLVRSETNGGFSAGNNFGIQRADAEAYLLLNSDTLVRPGAFRTLLETMEQSPEAGLVSPRLEWPDGTPQVSCFRFFRPSTELIRSAVTGPVTRLFSGSDVPWPTDENGGHQPCNPDWTSFACVLIRRSVIEDVGLMDDGYFMYYDDVDYCRLAKDKGWTVAHCPGAHVVHLRGGSSSVKSLKQKRQRRPRYYFAARTRYYAKHFGRLGLLRANLYWTLGFLIANSRRVLGGRRSPHCVAEWRDIWTNFLHPMTGRHR